MFNCIKESFNLTNKYIILATPLILFSLLSSLYILFSVGGNLISLLVALVLFTLMLGAFLSGWFFMIKWGVNRIGLTKDYQMGVIGEENNRDSDLPRRIDDENPNSLILEFPAGVGEYFLPTLGMMFNIFVISALLLGVSYYAGMKFIGDIGIDGQTLTKAMQSVTALKAMLVSLNEEQLYKLNAWNILLFGSMIINYFLVMFAFPAMFFKEKNSFKAFWISLKDLFSTKFFKNLGMYLIIFMSYFVLSMFTTLFGGNPITHFVFTLLNFYYMVLVAVLVFNFYYKNYVQVGGQIDEIC